MTEHTNFDGRVLLIDDSDPTRTMYVAEQSALDAARATFYGPDMSMPDQFEMHKLRMFLIATNRKAQVETFLNSLAQPGKALALEEWQYAPNFVTGGALGEAAKAALGLNDADYAEAMRDASVFTIDDYGDPKPTVLAAIGKFLFGG